MAGNGGARPGAGRPRTKLSRVAGGLKKVTAEEVLAAVDEKAIWNELLSATTTIGGGKDSGPISVPDYRVRADVMKYLTNRRDGMPKQAVEMEHGGSVILQHSIPRPVRD